MTEYQKLVGKLIYLSITRHDIPYDAHCVSQHMHSLLQSHFKASVRVLRYLKQASRTWIQFYKGISLNLCAFSDADLAKCPVSRKYVSGFCVYLGNGVVYWKKKKQDTISRSSDEAEYRCMTSTTCEIIWISNILKYLGIEVLFHVELYCDNRETIQIVENLVFHEKTKHSEIDIHLVREKVPSGIIIIFQVASANQVANIFTKSLSISQHK